MKRESQFVLILLCALAAPTAWGQAPGRIAAKAAEPMGRFFFTPAQRASLDIARTRRARNTLSTEGMEETAAPVAQSVTYGGMVRRSDGKSTVWINGRPVNDSEPIGGISVVGRIRSDGSVSLQVPQSGRSVDLKPGQSVELLSGTIEEAFSRKHVQPDPKPAAKVGLEPKPAAKSAPPERAQDERDREEQQQKVEEVLRALREGASAKSGAAATPPAQ